ncbi:MAG: family 16 glycosylhydrolase [Melioribacteraceae bacterium]|nr:family 16 glycosylhydrolase [Melioribacteraceae bacterium]MCF8266182.1 family 16 glycosylhydrolase [Melioribacteraceae bacterium]MCF8431638.1 family 16 glycosylhydrolase [Melioribacteraceae bacterium]
MIKKTTIILILLIAVPLLAKKYKGAEYRSLDYYKYGKFEVRYKPVDRLAIVSSFFTYSDSVSQTGDWNEIDIEIIAKYEQSVQFNIIDPVPGYEIRHNHVQFNPYDDYHVYGFEWTPDYVAWFIDSVEVYRISGRNVSTLNHGQKIMMNIWNPEFIDWVGKWDDTFMPAFTYYDWISYSSFTPGSGNYGTDNNFTFEWKDDLDSMDTNRWETATHTFAGNKSDFLPENVIFQDGKMILALTYQDAVGFTDNNPPAFMWASANYNSDITIKYSEEMDANVMENVSNYILPGAQVLSANLAPNQTVITLKTNNYDPFTASSVIIKSAVDDWEVPNSVGLKSYVVFPIEKLTFPLKLNMGGEAFGEFIPDLLWTAETTHGYPQGNPKKWKPDIQNTELDQLYQEERIGIPYYLIKLDNGIYNIKLHFAENKFDAAGKRMFDIIVENEEYFSDLDIYAEAGKNSALIKEINNVTVDDYRLDIYFQEELDSAVVAGIEIEQIATGVGESQSVPEEIKLYQNYPNPFNGTTKIRYSLNKPQEVTIKFFDIKGELVYKKELTNNSKGINEFSWRPTTNRNQSLNSGVYFYRVEGENISNTNKIVYLK